MRKFLTLTVFCFCSFLLLVAGTSSAVEIPFAVDDYIPELFTDTELLLRGSAVISGSSDSFENDSEGGSYYLSESRKSDYDAFSIGGSGFFSRRHITVSNWYTFTTNFSGSFNNRTGSIQSDRTASSVDQSRSESENTRKARRSIISPRLDVGKYIAGDFHISSILALSYAYERVNSNDDVRFDELTTIIGTTASRNTRFRESSNPSVVNSLNISGEILVGHGRMYDGVFAFTAISMIEDLDRKNLLLKVPTESEMRELTEIIYQNRLKHVVDRRIRQIESLDAIISYLETREIVNSEKNLTSMVISDVWEYFPDASHNFGFMIRGGFGMSSSCYSRQQNYELTERNLTETYDINNPAAVTTASDQTTKYRRFSDNHYRRSMPYFTVRIDKGKPITNRLQLDLMTQAWMYFSAKDTSENIYLHYVDGIFDHINSSYSSHNKDSYTRFLLLGNLNYTFDSRTSAFAHVSYDRHDFDQIDVIDTTTVNKGGYDLSLRCGLVRRISIPTSVYANIEYNRNTISLNSNSIGDFTKDRYRISAGVSHYLY